MRSQLANEIRAAVRHAKTAKRLYLASLEPGQEMSYASLAVIAKRLRIDPAIAAMVVVLASREESGVVVSLVAGMNQRYLHRQAMAKAQAKRKGKR